MGIGNSPFQVDCNTPTINNNEQHNTVAQHGTANLLSETQDGGILPVETHVDEGLGEIGDGHSPPNPSPPSHPNSTQPTSTDLTGSQYPQHTGDGPYSPTKKRRRKDKRTAARLNIATLNMKGRGTIPPDCSNDKWSKINQIMRDEKLAILAVQETHLTQQAVDSLHSLFGKRILILHSEPQERPSTSKGVAFVINKERLETKDISLTEVVPGRAALLTCKWHNTVKLRILNIYAPNDRNENGKFWDDLSETWDSKNYTNPSVMLGDFNIVEESKDRLPERPDQTAAVHALQNLCMKFRLIDTWRERYPEIREFTYNQDHGFSSSRIDRIYLNDRLGKNAIDWATQPAPAISTDHMLLSTSLADDKIPYVGNGRWIIPKIVLADHGFLKYVSEAGKNVLSRTKPGVPTSDPRNIQRLYHSLKTDLLEFARATAKANIPKIIRRINKLKEERKTILNSPSPRDEQYVVTQAAALLERIHTLEARRFNATRKSIATKDWTHGEKITKYWVQTS
ncbi:DNase I-like protein, partial [Trametopsis cervina]